MGVAVRRFEKAVVLHFPIDEFSGVAVTLDRDGSPSLDTLVDAGIDALDEIRPDQ